MDLSQVYDLDSRLYVELVPSNQSKTVLSTLVSELEKDIQGNYIRPLKWHITVIHFGKVRDVYTDLLDVLPQLTIAQFLIALNQYAQASKTILPVEIDLQTDCYDLFGEQSNVLVLRFKPTPQIIEAHRLALAHLVTFFTRCGLAKPLEFMKANRNFQHALNIKPHLTLIRKVETPLLLVPPVLVMQFRPADIAGL